jgi:hypothetical protein
MVLPNKLDYSRMAANQKSCQGTLQAVTYPSLDLHKVELGNCTLPFDMSSGSVRPLVPEVDKWAVF